MGSGADPQTGATRQDAYRLAALASPLGLLVILAHGMPVLDLIGVALLALLFGLWAWCAYQAAKQRQGWERHAWQWFAAGAVVLVLQAVFFGVSRLVDPRFAADIATREAAPDLAYPLLIVGLLILARRRSRSSVVVRGLDAVLVAGGVFFMLWSAVFRDLWDVTAQPVDERIELISYPVLGAAVAASAWLILGREGRQLPAYRLVAVAATIPLLTDTASAFLGFQGDDLGGRIGDLGLLVAGVFWVLAARVASRSPPWPTGEVPPASRLENYLPLATIALALGTAVQTVNEHGSISSLQFWLAILLILVLLARMGVTLAQNTKLERSLRNLLEERTRLLRFVSHELANPLSPLRLGLNLMHRSARDPAEQQRTLDNMDRSLGRLTRLSNDIRALALAETGRLVVDAKPGDLTRVAQRAVQAVQGDAEAKGVTVTMGPATAVVGQMDDERIGQVVDNLLSNAIKYTPRGGQVTVRVELRDGVGRVAVADDGLGLGDAQKADLFKAFRRFHPGVAPGLGLGLHLSRTLVEAHGGRMGVDSPGAGKGSTFWFTVPLGDARVDAAASLASSPAGPVPASPLADDAGGPRP